MSDQFQPVKSSDRTLEILEVLADAPERLGLGQLARQLSIPKSSLHGILRTMVRRGWVETDPSGTVFGLGLRSLLVGSSYVERDDIVARTQPVLDWLAADLGETAHLGRLDEADVVYLAKRDSPHPVRMHSVIGRRVPAHACALGKVLLAERSDLDVAELLPDSLPVLTPATIGDRDILLADLARIRLEGFARDDEEHVEGVRSFAVALRTRRPPIEAVSVSVPSFRLDVALERRVVAALRKVHDRLLGD